MDGLAHTWTPFFRVFFLALKKICCLFFCWQKWFKATRPLKHVAFLGDRSRFPKKGIRWNWYAAVYFESCKSLSTVCFSDVSFNSCSINLTLDSRNADQPNLLSYIPTNLTYVVFWNYSCHYSNADFKHLSLLCGPLQTLFTNFLTTTIFDWKILFNWQQVLFWNYFKVDILCGPLQLPYLLIVRPQTLIGVHRAPGVS